jgi:hypothetical protein
VIAVEGEIENEANDLLVERKSITQYEEKVH